MKASVFALAALLVVCLSQGTSASTFEAFQQNNYQGNVHEIKSCGCYPLIYQGSYKWIGTKNSGGAFNTAYCGGKPFERFAKGQSFEFPDGVGFQSFQIYC